MTTPGGAEPRPLPALRFDVEAMPIEHEGKPMFVLHDTEGLTQKSVLLSPATMLIVSLFDGRATAAEIRGAFAKATGTMLQDHELERISAQLAKAEMLETPELQARRRKLLEDFKAAPTRKAALAGAAYPAPTLELAAFLGKYFRDGRGPGRGPAEAPSKPAPPVGVLAPHIDFGRGGPAYAWSYGALSEAPPPDVVVALGVAHMSPPSPWVLTKKAYETPWGPVALDAELYDAIRSELWYDPLEDEWAHRKEHSLEFQAVWLKFLWRERTPPWVPILCSNFERFCSDRPPSTVPTVETAIQAIGARLAELSKKRRVLVLAGVDLAHVGPKFGDEHKLGSELFKKIEEEDRRSLGHATALEADGFYMSVVADGNWRKVCGLSATYTFLRWMKALGGPGTAGRLLAYDQSPDPMGGIVSYASALFESPG